MEGTLARAASAVQIRPDLLIQGLPRIARSHRDPDLAHTHPYLCANFQQLRADRRSLCLRPLRCFESQPPQSADQDISHHGEVQPQLVGRIVSALTRSANKL